MRARHTHLGLGARRPGECPGCDRIRANHWREQSRGPQMPRWVPWAPWLVVAALLASMAISLAQGRGFAAVLVAPLLINAAVGVMLRRGPWRQP